MFKLRILTVGVLCLTTAVSAQRKRKKTSEPAFKLETQHVSGLKFRNIGPAMTSGRIADIEVNSKNKFQWYVASASGGVWKTDNAGTTFYPIFDGQGSYSIACVKLAPTDPNIVWVGSGENNNQRSVAYGDGVYKSLDGGKSWKNMGLKTSEHIGNIVIHPTNPDIVYVAAYGPLWKKGGERGIYRTTDGGENWERVLFVSEHTGFSDIMMDPSNPDVLYCAAHQRRRHVFTYIGGGPESAVYKSTDAGKTWKKIMKGMPQEDLGRVGLGISPTNPEKVYAIVEAANGKGGFFASSNRGEQWMKLSDYTTSGNYYQEIIVHPKNDQIIYAMDTWMHYSVDGGKTFMNVPEDKKHVDNHDIWIDPDAPDHMVAACDGGLYETFDGTKSWAFKANLPVTQFYKVALDNDYPFYNVYGGTQDNNTLGGPSRTTNSVGIRNSDWFITNTGDGFEPQIDPTNPDIVYAQSQYGYLVRYDKKSGEKVNIQPKPKEGEPALRWNWDAPLLISSHNNKRIYFAANKLYRSDNQGSSWTAISNDLTTQVDRNTLKVMGRVWGVDAVMKNRSTTIYGNIVALSESPKDENVIVVGTDDGLIQITEDGGKNWRKVSQVTGIPSKTYVNEVVCSQHDRNTLYAVFNNHKNGDFKPYVMKSKDLGKTWTAIQTNLPKKGSTYCLEEDHVDPKLLFVGTEFGVFTSVNGGQHWAQMKSGLPIIAVRDMEIQKRENDLVLATFGRGFYVMDDYSPLRTMKKETFDADAHIFPIKDALVYQEANPYGLSGIGDQGAALYATPNPQMGATFTYHLKERMSTAKQARQKKEKELAKAGKDVKYPSMDALQNEDMEAAPYVMMMIHDDKGQVVRKMKVAAAKGTHRITWDGRYNTTTPVALQKRQAGKYGSKDLGFPAMPGDYSVTMYSISQKEVKKLSEPVKFKLVPLNNKTMPAARAQELALARAQLSELRRKMGGMSKNMTDISNKVKHFRKAVETAPEVPMDIIPEVHQMEMELVKLEHTMYGNSTASKHQFETLPGAWGRLGNAVYAMWNCSSDPTGTHLQEMKMAEKMMGEAETMMQTLKQRIDQMEDQFVKWGAPYTPGREKVEE